MNPFSIVITALVLISSAHAETTAAPSPAKLGASAPVSAPTAAAVVAPSATPAAPMTDAEKKKLTSEFQKALSNQRSALAHQEKSSMKELVASQGMKQKKWKEDEKNARHQFFDQHMSGPERRDYVQAYKKKKELFDASIKEELSAAKKSWADKNAALKVSQKDLEAKFNAAISQGTRPSADLWPKNN